VGNRLFRVLVVLLAVALAILLALRVRRVVRVAAPAALVGGTLMVAGWLPHLTGRIRGEEPLRAVATCYLGTSREF
jgi:uncharacterized membrane protein YgdD (TMEM256/DUF423 family)